MNTITKHVVLLGLCLILGQVHAQEQVKDSIKTETNSYKVEKLIGLKKTIETEEREYLKLEVEAINERLELGSITTNDAEQLKSEAAKNRALNIESRIAIIDRKIDLLKRNEDYVFSDGSSVSVIGIGKDENKTFAGVMINNKNTNKPKKYDVRTTSDLVFALGFNNTLSEGKDLGDDYSVMGSGFVELGWAWKTRLLKNSNAVRLKYGLSFQWNKLNAKNDKYFEQNGDVTTLEEFPVGLKESQFRVTNLVVPVHFEFGPSKKIEKDNYFRYSTQNKFKVGLGGYAGLRLASQQKLNYKEDGDRVKQKIKKNYNASDFVYGLSAYVGYGSIGIYAKYDLNPLFKDQSVDQNNISLGFRFDLD
ncbi:hypothetical protein [Lacinutrix undariae]